MLCVGVTITQMAYSHARAVAMNIRTALVTENAAITSVAIGGSITAGTSFKNWGLKEHLYHVRAINMLKTKFYKCFKIYK